MPGFAGSGERAEYLHLLAGMRADVVRVYGDPARRQGFAILRRAAALGDFELESDVDSQLAYQHRLLRQFTAVAVLCVCLVVAMVVLIALTVRAFVTQGNIFASLDNAVAMALAVLGLVFVVVIGVAAAACGVYVTREIARVRRRHADLQRDRLVYE